MFRDAILLLMLSVVGRAALITATIYHLLKHLECLQKLERDIEALPEDANSNQLQQVRYLDAPIKETMRKPAVIRFSPEPVTPPGGALIC